jgi:hypothetical protein
MKRTPLTATPSKNQLTPKEEDVIIAKLNGKEAQKTKRITLDMPIQLYEAMQAARLKRGLTTFSGAIFQAAYEYIEKGQKH